MRCSISYCLHSIASLNSIVTVLHTLMHTCRQRDTDTFQYIKTDGGSEKRSTYCNSHCVLWDLYAVAGQKTNVLIIYCLSYILLFPLFVCWFSSPYTHTHTHKHVQTDSIAVKTNESFATLCMFVQYLMLLNDINIKASVWSETFPFCSFSSSTTCPTHTYTMIVLCNFLCVREFIAVLSSFCISSEPVCICVSYQCCVSVWGWEPYIIVVLYQIVYHTKTHIDKSRKADTHTHMHTLGFQTDSYCFF